MTEERAYHGHSLDITISPDGGEAIDIGILQECEIRATFERDDIFGSGSILVQHRIRRALRVTVKAAMAAFDAEMMGEMLGTWVDGTGSGSVLDSSTLPLFDVVGAVTDEVNGLEYTVTADDTDFVDIPLLTAKLDDWMIPSVEGTAKNVSFVETPAV